MTDTIGITTDATADQSTTGPDANEETPAAGSPQALRECLDVDPATLLLGDNVRAAAQLDRPFLASLREFGVMDPIHATRSDDGTLTVKRGQRRALGAVKVGLASVPVLIVADDDTEAERITKQWHENERRDALTDSDRLAAIEQLTILGVPAGSIAKRLGTQRKVIDAAVAANASQVAKTAATKHALTLTDSALVAGFETDQQVVEDILTAARDGRSTEHVAQRARDARERQQVHDETVTALTDAGVTVIDRPEYTNKRIKELRDIRLVAKNGAARSKAPTQAEHASCPGHAAYVTVDAWSATPRARTTYVCTDPSGNGHALHSHACTTMPGESPTGPMSEEQKAERRTLIANNKAWDAAEKVRRAWIADALLARTSAPKDAEVFLARAVVHGEHTQDGNRLYTALTTGQDDYDYSYNYEATQRLIRRAEAATPRQALMLALALLVCEWESGTSRNTWRHPSERDRRYLTALIQWGYQPSDVEQLILIPAGTDQARGLVAPEGEADGEPSTSALADLTDGIGADDVGAPVDPVHEDNDTEDPCDLDGDADGADHDV